MLTFLSGYRTYIIATLLVIVGVINVLTGETTTASFFQDPNLLIILNGLGLGSLRAAL